jgi:hypothetical protein
MEKLEKRWLEKFNKLTTTLDKFLKRAVGWWGMRAIIGFC